MTTDQNCLFCKIAAGEIPAQVVHTDDDTVAFRDINPQAPTHVLVIPRRHIASLKDAAPADEGVLGRLLLTAARVARDEGLAEGGYRTVVNTGAGAGQSVFHVHAHVIGGRALSWPPG
jgi:histidine triad (HIT) family protein